MKLTIDFLTGLPVFSPPEQVKVISTNGGGGGGGTMITVSTTPPDNPTLNQLWVDIS